MDRIHTLHPEGKAGVNIEARLYEQTKSAILAALEEAGPLPFKKMVAEATARLPAGFSGRPAWYITTVNLDLIARGQVMRDSSKRPPLLSRPTL